MTARDLAFLAARLVAVYIGISALDSLFLALGFLIDRGQPTKVSIVNLLGPVTTGIAALWLWSNARRLMGLFVHSPDAPAPIDAGDRSLGPAAAWAIAIAGLWIAVTSLPGLANNLGSAFLQPESGLFHRESIEANFSFRTQSLLFAAGHVAELAIGILLFRWGRNRGMESPR